MLKDITDRYPHCIPQNRNSYHPPEDFVIPPPPQKGADARELKKKTIIYMDILCPVIMPSTTRVVFSSLLWIIKRNQLK